MTASETEMYDAVVIGSGFGGCFAALPLVEAGFRVLMLERGGWVERGEHNWGEAGAFVLTSHYTTESAYTLSSGMRRKPQGLCTCVGGPSVFYGGASFRFRDRDFEPAPEIVGESRAVWPLSYGELEPHYAAVERLLGIAGQSGEDPTEPPRSSPYPEPALPLAPPSRRISEAASALGLNPFRIPMAIDGRTCVSCTTCDAFACAVGAKNDLASRLIPHLLAMGMTLRPNTVVGRVRESSDGFTVGAVDSASGEKLEFSGRRVVLAAGALATPHLLLASELARQNPGAEAIGRYLMRHCNAMTYGFFRERPNPEDRHHKQVAIHDYYFGDSDRPELGKLGNIQQVMAPPGSLIRAMLPQGMKTLAGALVANLTGLLVIAEDEPRAENRVQLDNRVTDRFGLPGARISHRYTARDLAARKTLLRRARQVLRQAGSLFHVTWNVNTFSHAVGTARMGVDPRTSVLDPECRFRGVPNLWVTDGSVFPTSAGVNPSLTIAANALRVGSIIAAEGI